MNMTKLDGLMIQRHSWWLWEMSRPWRAMWACVVLTLEIASRLSNIATARNGWIMYMVPINLNVLSPQEIQLHKLTNYHNIDGEPEQVQAYYSETWPRIPIVDTTPRIDYLQNQIRVWWVPSTMVGIFQAASRRKLNNRPSVPTKQHAMQFLPTSKNQLSQCQNQAYIMEALVLWPSSAGARPFLLVSSAEGIRQFFTLQTI